ncbi:MAG: DsbA family protein [Xanthobacteraceae bacterium]|nr:DsbA family protein [Xanthobacteraceae bacterium]QYK46065.1 MAG: DsbA family protein [Xanthobacteraceae bacterium]
MTLAFRPRLWLGALCAAAVMTVSASAQTSPAQKEEFEKIIREYLLKNPEVIQEAIVELRKRQEQAEIKARSEALKTQRETLFNSPRGIVIGNPKGNVTLVEFFDYNCGYCKKALGDVNELLKNDPNIKIVLKELPILSEGSEEAARVAVAVRLQDPSKYLAFHRALLGGRGEANLQRALAAAQQAGLDVERIKKDLTNPEVEATLKENAALAQALAISGTPTYVLGDQLIPGALPYNRLVVAIAAVRKCGKVEC